MDLYFYSSKILAPLIVPSNFLIILLIVFFYLSVLKNKEKFKKIFSIFFIIFSLITLLPLGENLIYHALEKQYKNAKLPNDIDFIFVPAGNKERIVKAIEIKNNYIPGGVKIIYSNGNPYLKTKNWKDYESDFFEIMISNSSIDRKDVVFLPNARNTIENFKQLNQYLLGKKNKKILLVTSAFHIKRSLIIAKKYNIEIQAFPSSFLARQQNFSLVNFYQDMKLMKNISFFDIFFRELLGIFAAKVVL